MPNDHMIGATISAVSLGALLLGFNRPKPTTPATAPTRDDWVRIVDPLPPADEPEPPSSDPDRTSSTEVAIAVPRLPDIPPVTPPGPFIQEVERPPPPGVEPIRGAVTIPRTGSAAIGRAVGRIFNPDQLDRLPVARVQQAPLYPFELRKAGITGVVEVGFIVTAGGDVADVYVIQSTNRAFEAPALQAVSRWKFRPGLRGGRAVNTRMSVPIVFKFAG